MSTSIVIVDDHRDFSSLLEQYLGLTEDASFRVLGAARDGLEALEMIRTMLPDIVLLDIRMPRLDGFGLLESVNALSLPKKPKFIIVSAMKDPDLEARALRLGAACCFGKPLDLRLLVGRIREVAG